MAYASWNVVFGEQPSAAKWNILGTNDAAFNSYIQADGTAVKLLDDAGNEILRSTKTASAVNELTVANAATGNGPSLSATGGDSNIDINLTPKGTGVVKIGGNPIGAGAWTSYTPTIAGGVLGNGTVTGSYVQIGKTVHFKIKFTLGSTSTAPSGTTYTLPVTASTTNLDTGFAGFAFWGGYTDSSASTNTPSLVRLEGSTTIRPLYWSTATAGTTTGNPPTVPATNDVMQLGGTYEAA